MRCGPACKPRERTRANGSMLHARLGRLLRAAPRQLDVGLAVVLDGGKPEHRALVLTWRDAYETLLKDVLRDGVRGGQFRADTDISLASKFLLSSLNQLSRWYRPGGGKSAREIMDRFVDMFLHGVQAPG